MNKLQIRKIILSAACLILLVVAVIQSIMAAKASGKIVRTDKAIDEITIVNANGTFNIIKDGEQWVAGKNRYVISESSISSFLDNIKTISVLEKIGSASSEENVTRYELSEGKVISVEAKSNGKVIRSMKIGKTSTTDSQSYITIDNNSDIYLAAGNLRNTYQKTLSDIRDKKVIEFNADEISSITIKPVSGNNWTLSRSGEGDESSWSISGAEVDVDSNKASSWFDDLATLYTTEWYEDSQVAGLNGNLEVSAIVSVNNKNVSFNFYKIPAAAEGEADIYYGTCSETPYTFKLAEYSVNRFKKEPDTLAK